MHDTLPTPTTVDWPHVAHQVAERHVDELTVRFVDVHGFDPPYRCPTPASGPVIVGAGHLADCTLALAADDAGVDVDVDLVTAGPFCGCVTCEVREVLAACWRAVVEAQADGQHPPVSQPDGFDGCAECVAHEVVAAVWDTVAAASSDGFVLPDDMAV